MAEVFTKRCTYLQENCKEQMRQLAVKNGNISLDNCIRVSICVGILFKMLDFLNVHPFLVKSPEFRKQMTFTSIFKFQLTYYKYEK